MKAELRVVTLAVRVAGHKVEEWLVVQSRLARALGVCAASAYERHLPCGIAFEPTHGSSCRVAVDM